MEKLNLFIEAYSRKRSKNKEIADISEDINCFSEVK